MDTLDTTAPTVDPAQFPPTPQEPTGNNLVHETKPLIYEETPVIQPVDAQMPSVQPEPPAPPAVPPQESMQPSSPVPPIPPVVRSGNSIVGMVKNIVLIVILFGVGIGLSMLLKQYIPITIPAIPSFALKNPLLPTPVALVTPTVGTNPYANWKSYTVTSGVGNQIVNGITYKLPNDILAPICDGGNCSSSGTYLPGGTRFTLDARGLGQLLPDFRGKILTDQGGREFSMKDAQVAGRPAKEFSGIFTGTTSGGYAFSRMRGVMVEVTDTLSVEFNHFTPTLVNADFTADDALFDKILQSVQISLPLPSPKASPSTTTSPSVAPTIAPSPTSVVTP